MQKKNLRTEFKTRNSEKIIIEGIAGAKVEAIVQGAEYSTKTSLAYIQDVLKLTPEEEKMLIEQQALNLLMHGTAIHRIRELIESNQLDPEFMNRPLVIKAIYKGIVENYQSGFIMDSEIIEKYNISQQTLHDAALEGWQHPVPWMSIYTALQIKEQAHIENNDFYEMISKLAPRSVFRQFRVVKDKLTDEQIQGIYAKLPIIKTFCELGITNEEYFEEYQTLYESEDREKADVFAGFIRRILDIGITDRRFVNKCTELKLAGEDSKAEQYLQIAELISKTPSQEVKQLETQLIGELADTDNPFEAYKKIETVFIKNNLPLVGKVYKVFEALYPSSLLNDMIDSSGAVSPVLKRQQERHRYYTIYKDLLNIHIRSGNRSLKRYLHIIAEGSEIVDGFNRGEVKNDDPLLKRYLAKIATLHLHSQMGGSENVVEEENPEVQIQMLNESLAVKPGQSLTDRVSEMYLVPIGINSISEALALMDDTRTSAEMRAINFSKDPSTIKLAAGDLLKGIDHRYFGTILQNGSVSKEYLGPRTESDTTPFDTDVSLVLEEDVKEHGFAEAVDKSYAVEYGKLIFAFKDRGQFSRTRNSINPEDVDEPKEQQGKYELFSVSAEARHCGIRTGLPDTEIDFIILNDPEGDEKIFESACIEVAQNGCYIPIVDKNGSLLYSHEQYLSYRKFFAGLKEFDANTYDFKPTVAGDRHYDEVANIIQKLRASAAEGQKLNETVTLAVKDLLASKGIILRTKFDSDIGGARLEDTGSTGRGVSAPGKFDFDYMLKLDINEFRRSAEIATAIKSICEFSEDNSHSEDGGYEQIRLREVTSIGGHKLTEPVDIDIGINSNTDLEMYGTHHALRDRYEWIKENLSEEAFEQVAANVILTKEILKNAAVYKKLEDGGMGGVGVENWILSNNGNMFEAFKGFELAAFTPDGNLVPYDEFVKKYKIIDPGINTKKNKHDNFVLVMSEDGYQKTAHADA